MADRGNNSIDIRGRTAIYPERARTHHHLRSSTSSARRSRSPTPLSRIHRPSTDLGAMIKPDHISHAKYYAIQTVLMDQDKIIRDYDHDLRTKRTQITDLNKDLDAAKSKLRRTQNSLTLRDDEVRKLEIDLKKARNQRDGADRELIRRKEARDDEDEADADLFRLGQKVLAEQTKQAASFADENALLRNTIGERDRAISSLNDQIVRISMASDDEKMALAMETNAQRTLALIQGLQQEVAERDTRIADLEAKNTALDTANGSLKEENEKMGKRIVVRMKALEAATKRAKDAKDISEDQAKLITKLMEGNHRLAAAARPG